MGNDFGSTRANDEYRRRESARNSKPTKGAEILKDLRSNGIINGKSEAEIIKELAREAAEESGQPAMGRAVEEFIKTTPALISEGTIGVQNFGAMGGYLRAMGQFPPYDLNQLRDAFAVLVERNGLVLKDGVDTGLPSEEDFEGRSLAELRDLARGGTGNVGPLDSW